jgi:hypothetical protein
MPVQEAPTAAASVVKIFPILKDVLAVFGLIDPWNSEEVGLACVQLGDFHGFPQLGTHWGKNQILG